MSILILPGRAAYLSLLIRTYVPILDKMNLKNKWRKFVKYFLLKGKKSEAERCIVGAENFFFVITFTKKKLEIHVKKEGTVSMIVRDLVVSAEVMEEETKDGIFVIYERYENNECESNGRLFTQKDCEPEERVEIMEEKNGGSLKHLYSYSVTDSIEPVLVQIRLEHPELLKSSKAALIS
ncbi:hypothetical protein EBO34_03500 [Alteribacter keqinensis]|uniref:Uncharacterized protein n=2 Tax=Alteribacter keqinensis TaxID=2483800 RepID=A0A3M7TVM1_9BACI|nr:hypothetical protein EBO34_03500 [Alteribacter keqinensis]